MRFAGAFTANHFRAFDGTDTRLAELCAAAHWTMSDAIEILPFAALERQLSQNRVIYVPEAKI